MTSIFDGLSRAIAYEYCCTSFRAFCDRRTGELHYGASLLGIVNRGSTAISAIDPNRKGIGAEDLFALEDRPDFFHWSLAPFRISFSRFEDVRTFPSVDGPFVWADVPLLLTGWRAARSRFGSVAAVVSGFISRLDRYLGRIADLLKRILKEPTYSPVGMVLRERDWFLHHGSHPPKTRYVAGRRGVAGARVPMPIAA